MQNTAMHWKLAAAINLQGLDELVRQGKGGTDRHFVGAPLELLRYALALMNSAAALVVLRVVSTRRAYLGPVFAILFAVLVGGASVYLPLHGFLQHISQP